MHDGERSYKLAASWPRMADTDSGHDDGSGRYLGAKARDAARKAARRVFSTLQSDAVDRVYVTLRETSRWVAEDARKTHYFMVLRTPVQRDVVVGRPGGGPRSLLVNARFTYEAVAISREAYEAAARPVAVPGVQVR